jgi:CheY-like chemotaxis protein
MERAVTDTTSWLKGRRVLLIEDEYLVAMQMARQFADFGVEVVGPVATLDRALAFANGGALDAAVVDINLRGMMAYEVADQLQERGIPFVFASGYDRSTIPPRFAGVIYCEKPIDPRQVAQALSGALGG